MKTHTRFQSESSLKAIIGVYLKTQRADYAQLAIEAQTELARRAHWGGMTCECCNGHGWLRDMVGEGDSMCYDCGGTGTIIPERELKHA